MKFHQALIILATAALAAIPLRAVHAAPARLPASLYPAGATVTYNPSLSNGEMDCMWGLFCDGNVPLFHSVPQTMLHRLQGWDQLATVPELHEPRLVFWLFASRYDPTPDAYGHAWSAVAFQDLRFRTHIHGYDRLAGHFQLLPAGVTGGSLAVHERSGSRDIVVMAAWHGTTEVEALVMYKHHSAAESVAIAALARQVRQAMTLGA